MLLFGRTPTGFRIHIGNAELKSDTGRKWAPTFCGSEMFQYADNATDVPYQDADEFCKNCFRQVAWESMQEYYLLTEEIKRTLRTRGNPLAVKGTISNAVAKSRNANFKNLELMADRKILRAKLHKESRVIERIKP